MRSDPGMQSSWERCGYDQAEDRSKPVAGVGREGGPALDALTRVALLMAAVLPWFSVFSGTYGLYFYVVLAVTLLAQWLLIPVLVFAVPLAVLLLLLMPAGAVYAAVRRPPQGWLGRLTGVGCLVSMVLAVGYGGLMMVIATAPTFADGAAKTFDLSLLWRAGVLAAGFVATWLAWRWARRQPR